MITRFNRNFTICLAFGIILVSADIAQACMCGSGPDVGFRLANSDVAGVFKLQSFVEGEKLADGSQGYGKAIFTAEQVFKGDIKPGGEIEVQNTAAHSCMRTFGKDALDQEFLFYLNRPNVAGHLWRVGSCSGSVFVGHARGDLLYLEKLARVRGKTRLSGRVSQYFGASLSTETSDYKNLVESPVVIRGNGKTIEIKTDENGIYEIYDLPPGKYSVTPVTIKGFKFVEAGPILNPLKKDPRFAEVLIKPKGVTEKDITFHIDNSIKGRVLDSQGRALNDVVVELVPARGRRPDDLYEEDTTKKDGRFEFASVPEGSYLILVNGGGKVTAAAPFGKFYYPGTASRGEAAPVRIGPGEFINNLVLTAPKTAKTVTISGVILYEDGKPAAKTIVEFHPEIKDEEDEVDDEDLTEDGFRRVRLDGDPNLMVTTDDFGRFSIKVLKGQTGELQAWDYLLGNEYTHCPKVDKLVRDILDAKNAQATGGARSISTTVVTPSIRIEDAGNQTGIELRFPFPFCEKKE